MFDTLIVEDNSVFRKSLAEMLRDRFREMRIKEAAGGAQAESMISEQVPELIFMDVRLSDESGLELTQRIKKTNHTTTIIILTTHDLEEYREAARLYGADYFMAKGSSSSQEIIDLVESILSNQAGFDNDSLP